MLDTDCLYHLSQLVGTLVCGEDAQLVRAKIAEAELDGLSTQDSSEPDLRASLYTNPLFNFCLDRLAQDRASWREARAATQPHKLETDVESAAPPRSEDDAPRRTNSDAAERKLRRENSQLAKDLKAKALICHDLRIQLSQTHQIFECLLATLEDDAETVPGLLVALIKGEILFSSSIKKVVEKVILLKCEARELKRPAPPRPSVMRRQHSEYASRRRFRMPPPAEFEGDLFKTPQSVFAEDDPRPHTHCLEVNEDMSFMRGYLGIARPAEEVPRAPPPPSVDSWPHRHVHTRGGSHYRSATALQPAPPPGSETTRSRRSGGKIMHAISKFLNGAGASALRKNPSFID